ncbi:MAG: anthranilate synthase component I family protein, partial [Thermodesulfobacteriota bacterium]|nr:anthranilate synthase component I family protein [Thermodesulfobacteriota bacterium]
MNEIENITQRITGIHTERIDLKESFLDFSARFSSMPGTVILMSGGDLDCARNNILAARPWLTLQGGRNGIIITAEGHSSLLEADPFDALSMVLDTFSMKDPHLPVPVGAGLFGYLSYDLKDRLEDLPRTSIDDLCLPHIFLFAPSILVVQDRIDGSTHLCLPKRVFSGRSTLDDDLDIFKKALASDAWTGGNESWSASGFGSNFTRADYMEAIEKIKEYIASGHVYQVNMSQRFEMEFLGDTFSLFKALYNINPAPFFAYINSGDHQIISTSPERFILRKGKRVETRPIKGTRPRGKTLTEDKELGRQLKQSKKDEAELSMIVDLLRNDLGKVCVGGSVRVLEHKRLEAYQNVYHLISIVEGTLKGGCDSVDLIKATFPGGSITGCPKIRA